MPNGKTHFEETELPELERFFAPIARLLENFAVRHHLKVDKYPKQNHAWDFLFRHPDGGTGSLQVLRGAGATLLVAAHRGLSEYERFRRSSYSWGMLTIARDDPDLGSVLLSLLKEIMELPLAKLVPDGRDYSGLWRPENAAEYHAYVDTLPIAVLD